MLEAVKAAPVVIRPATVTDVYIRGLEDIEDLGDCARFVCYVEQMPLGTQGPVEHHIRAQIVMQWEDVPAALRLAACAFMRKLRLRAQMPFLRLLH